MLWQWGNLKIKWYIASVWYQSVEIHVGFGTYTIIHGKKKKFVGREAKPNRNRNLAYDD
jgi:hypothetical protein